MAHEASVLVAFQPCGCWAGSLIGDSPSVDAWMAIWRESGCRIETLSLEATRRLATRCEAHTDAVDDRRYIWIDPGRRAGEPCIGGTRIPPEIIGGYIWAGDDLAKIADDYGVTVPQALVAAWYLGTYGSRTWRKRWGMWAQTAGGHLWSRKDQDQCPMPPTMKDTAS